MGNELAFSAAGQNASDRDRTRAGAAGQGFAGLAFPDAEGHVIAAIDLNELDIGFSWIGSIFHDSLPSALNMPMRASAISEGQMRMSPSPPTPKCRSAIFRARAAGLAGSLCVKQST